MVFILMGLFRTVVSCLLTGQQNQDEDTDSDSSDD